MIASVVRALVLSAAFAFAGFAADADPKQTFVDHCGGCHGDDAKGLEDLGPDLTASAFTKKLSDAELAEFLKVGRAQGAKDSKTGQLMPAFDYLTSAEMKAVIGYTRKPSK